MVNGSSKTSTRGETARRIARQRPDNIGNPVNGLIIKLGRCATKLHGREMLDFDTSVRFLLDLLDPRDQNMGRHRGLRGQELMHTQGDLGSKALCRHRPHGPHGQYRQRGGPCGARQRLAHGKGFGCIRCLVLHVSVSSQIT